MRADDYNYVSFTIWDDRKSFQSWMSGDAFKEAHGGGSIFGFIDMLVNATFTLNGAPKPAFWHGLLPISLPGDMSDKEVENGWRKVDADGKNKLATEAFAVANRFSVAEGSEVDFEQRCAADMCRHAEPQCTPRLVHEQPIVLYAWQSFVAHIKLIRQANACGSLLLI